MSRQPKFEILFSKLQVDVPDSNWHKTERIRKAEVVFYCGIMLSRWRKKGSRQPTKHNALAFILDTSTTSSNDVRIYFWT